MPEAQTDEQAALAAKLLGDSGALELQSVLDKLPAAAYTCDAEGLITYFNRRAVEIWGREPRLNDPADRYCGSFRLFSAKTGEPLRHEECWMALALRDKRGYNRQEIIIERPDGRRVHALAHANPITDPAGKLIGALNILIDLSDSQRAEQQAQTWAARLAAIVESSEDAIVGKNLDGIITSWNQAAERMYGYTAEEAVGRSIMLVIPEERRDEETQILARLRRGERVSHFETVRRHKDGRLLDVSLTISPIRGPDGSVIGASKIARDITGRKRTEQALQEREAELAEELADSRRLQELSAQLLQEEDPATLYSKIVDTARQVMRSDFASMQMLQPERGPGGQLRLLAFHGFDAASARLWQWVGADSGCPCGVALRERQREIVADVEQCSYLAGTEHLAAYRAAGVRAVQSTPLITRGGRLIGMLSTHWRAPYRPLERDLRLLDIIARQAADLMERMRALEALRASENRHRFLVELNTATQALTDPYWIMKGTAQMLGRQLDADRCIYAEVEPDEEGFHVLGDYTRGVRSMVGRWTLSQFGQVVRDLCRAGLNWVLEDAETDPRIPEARETYRAAEIRSGIVVPLRKGGQLVSGMAVQCRAPRQWSREDVELVELVVNRCWEAIERARALRRLAESEARARLALDVAGQGTWSWEQETDRVEADGRFREICGLPPDGVLRQDEVLARVHPEDLRRVQEALLAALNPKGSGLYSAEFRVVHQDGSQRWIVSRGQASFVGDNGGRPGMLLGTVLDITEIKRAEEQLKDADRRKDEFLATLSHELRNPLAPLSLAAQMLGNKVGGGEKAQELTQTVQRQVGHMVRLIDELMDISRISRGKIELRRQIVDLRSVVDNGVEIARPHIEAAQHRLTLRLPEETVQLHADPVRIGQILANLLNNAAKYTPPGGEITLAAAREGGEVVIRVRDTGSGLTAAALPHIFELFGRGEREQRNDGGLGIGLYLARGLAELHGGSLTASSEGAGRGSEFTLRLPGAVPAQAALPKAAAEPAANPPPAGVRALVVDDNRGAANMMGIALRTMGANVRVVYDGQAALDAASEFQPEIVFMDIGMAGMDGHEAARRMRPLHRDALMVAVSGWGQEDVRARSLEAGFDHHFVKPVDLPQLRQLLAGCKQRSARRPESSEAGAA